MSRRRTAAIAGASLAAGLLAGGFAAAAVPAVAETIAPTPSATSDTEAPDGAGRGPHEANGITEEELTGDTAEQVEAAVLAEYRDATIERMETDADGAAYEAHIVQADGTRATVTLDEEFAVTGIETRGPGGRGGDCEGDAEADATPDAESDANS